MNQAQLPRSALFLIIGLGIAALPACGGSSPPPAAPAPPPPVAAAPPPAPAPSPPPAAPEPAPTAAEAPPPAPAKRHHGHGIAAMLIESLETLDLKPEQKTAVEGIEADLDKLPEASKEPKAKLEADVVDGVAAGKIDHKKTDADINALGTAVAGTAPALQDAVNRLYKTLDGDQRKKLVANMRAKGKEVHEHMAEHEGKGPGMAMGGKEHEGKGPAGKGGEGKALGPGMHEHEGPGMHEHEGPGGHGMGDGPIMMLGDELALTPEQKEKLKAKLEPQMRANHAAMKAKMEVSVKHMDAVGTAFEGEKFDAKKAGVGAQAADMAKAMATAKVQFVETVLGVLTPEQRGKFAAHLKDHAGDMDENG